MHQRMALRRLGKPVYHPQVRRLNDQHVPDSPAERQPRIFPEETLIYLPADKIDT